MSGAARVFRLDEVRADGWFERLGEGSPSFDQLCDVIGARFVAFSVVAGVRIASVAVDTRTPDASVIEFSVGDNGPSQRLPLGEFRRRLASALIGDEDPSRPLPSSPRTDDLTAHIGFRYVLLAPIFDLRLCELKVVPGSPSLISVEIAGSAPEEVTLGELRLLIQERIRAEINRVKPPSPFAIDLNAVPEALRAAENGEHQRVIDILGAWPGPLSLLMRTAEGQSLSVEVKATLARALGVLGSAYVATDKHDWALEVLRLAIQWGQDGPGAWELFRRLGDAFVDRERVGEAIGLYRRAIQLGAPKGEILPRLASAFGMRGRRLATLAVLEELTRGGTGSGELARLGEEARTALGEAWTRYQQFLR